MSAHDNKPAEAGDLYDRFLSDLEALEGSAAPELGLLALVDEVSPLTAAPDQRSRLMAAATRQHRLARFESQVAELLDVGPDKARELLGRIDDPTAWSHELPGISFLWVEGGPKVEGALRGFIRVEAGVDFPHHEHLGDEASLVLEGGFEDRGRGRVFRVGDIDHMAAGTEHAYRALSDGPDLLALAVIHTGLCALGKKFLGR
ncbi:MAG: hypothetical protein ABW321_16270 [Polyangiales bacterium]